MMSITTLKTIPILQILFSGSISPYRQVSSFMVQSSSFLSRITTTSFIPAQSVLSFSQQSKMTFSSSTIAPQITPQTTRLFVSTADEDDVSNLRKFVSFDDSSITYTVDPGIGIQSRSPSVISIEEENSFNPTPIEDPKFSLAVKLGVAAEMNIDKVNPCTPIISHRGAFYHEPENTLEAFQKACDLGATAIELDVFRLPKCGTLVVFHGVGSDASPGWLRGHIVPSEDGDDIDLNILDLDYAEVRSLKIDRYGSEFACPPDRITNATYFPTLEEVLLLVKANKIQVTIELKYKGTAEDALALVEKLDMSDQVVFSSFQHDLIHRIRKLRPERCEITGLHKYRTGCLFSIPPESFVEMALAVDASEVHLRYDTCTKENISKIHAAGMDSMAWFRGHTAMRQDTTVKYLDVGNEDENMYYTVLQSGVRKMCVNRPEILKDLLDRFLVSDDAIA